ncbi:MAG: hypothetical protein ACRYE9_02235 [Janthinobacterium lividum]
MKNLPNFKDSILGASFFLMHVCVFIFNKKIKNISLHSKNILNIGVYLAIISGLMFFFMSLHNSNILVKIACFCILHGCMSVLWKMNRSQFIKNCQNNDYNRAISASITLCRFFVHNMYCLDNIDGVHNMYCICSMIMGIVGMLFLYWSNIYQRLKSNF